MKLATFSQCRYLNTLSQECSRRGIEIPEEIKDQLRAPDKLTGEEAGELIDNLKFELGW